MPDLDFLPAAVLLSRVVSKPVNNRLCLDLGHKAVASEMPHPRVVFLDLPDATPVTHSEEHLVVEVPAAPTNLTVQTSAVRGALELDWMPAVNSPAAFTVFRGDAATGPFAPVGTSTVATFLDTGLTIGQTYWYRVHARDAFGNLSAPSNIASGVPQDLTAPVTAIHYPTIPGRLLVTSEQNARVVARTEPGSTVRLMRGGATVREAVASTGLAALSFQSTQDDSNPRLSPDGRAVAYEVYRPAGGYYIRIRDITSGV